MNYLKLIVFLLIGCKASNKGMNLPCTKATAETIADAFIKKKHYEISLYKKDIAETNNEFIIEYISKDSLTLGGGAILKISKSDCKIIEKKLFQ